MDFLPSRARFWEQAPRPRLSHTISRLSFSVDDEAPNGAFRVLPDGCTDLLISIPRRGGAPTDARSWDARRQLLEDAVAAAARGRAGSTLLSEAADLAIREFERTGGRARVADVASRIGVGQRALERAFAETVGLRPKQLARVIRFGRARNALAKGRGAAEVALCAGYSDQPHMVREFRALAGTTPGALRSPTKNSR